MATYGPKGPEQWTRLEQKEEFSWGKCIEGWIDLGFQGAKLYGLFRKNEARLNQEYEETLQKMLHNPLQAEIIFGGFWAKTFSGFFDSLTQEEEQKAGMFNRIASDIAGLSGRKDKWEKTQRKTDDARERANQASRGASEDITNSLIGLLFGQEKPKKRRAGFI